jgi:hypothetical protein
VAPRWIVLSPSYDYTEPVLEDGSGPTYSVMDYAEVEAWSRNEAIAKGVAAMEEWPDIARGDDINPFKGVTADLLCPFCNDRYESGCFCFSCLLCGESLLDMDTLDKIRNRTDNCVEPPHMIATTRFSKTKRTRRILEWHRGQNT